MKDNEMCDACREALFRLAQQKHTSTRMQSIYGTLNRLNKDMNLLKDKLTDVAIKDLLNQDSELL